MRSRLRAAYVKLLANFYAFDASNGIDDWRRDAYISVNFRAALVVSMLVMSLSTLGVFGSVLRYGESSLTSVFSVVGLVFASVWILNRSLGLHDEAKATVLAATPSELNRWAIFGVITVFVSILLPVFLAIVRAAVMG